MLLVKGISPYNFLKHALIFAIGIDYRFQHPSPYETSLIVSFAKQPASPVVSL